MVLLKAKRSLSVVVVGYVCVIFTCSLTLIYTVISASDIGFELTGRDSAGIGGLATAISLAIRGHRVLVLEILPEIQEIGAGIQIAPNMGSILARLGIEPAIQEKAIVLETIEVVRWQNGKVLSKIPVNHQYGKTAVIHRADLQRALIDRISELDNIEMRLGATITDIDFDRTAVWLQDGEMVTGDVIVGADGIKSMIRNKMILDRANGILPTGDRAFRILIHREKMLRDKELAKLIDKPKAVRWVGPHRHIVGYPIRNHQLYNAVFIHPDNGSVGESWTIPGTKEEMMEMFCGWEPRVLKLIEASTQVLKSKLCLHPPLLTWVKGSCTLVGDACHPMLPYIAQGAAQALEDAAALGVILSNISSVKSIPFALGVYEKCRKKRAEAVQQSGTANRIPLHLPDGPEQVARDERFATVMKGDSSPDKWNDRETQQLLWGHDAEEAANQCWSECTRVKCHHHSLSARL
ncbi:monooxygenase [Paracoccidioides lutzii Pb01]|uniref:Monooxygenase n=1 Tax=Paracoccidioides lutzii (strain ATCC MYA-826 / Pb01) TaxID=502779 RepID=C1HBL9_PARBA|nr:monooxygenase [Paracoccidioides lutzii Pb01]EEH38433.2 monooxygenase [Paracoccidioides lutzii Pb01]